MTTTDQELVTAMPVDSGDAGGVHPSPDPAGKYLTVEPWEVEHGDVLFGLRSQVASILTDGEFWFYGDDRGTFIAKRRCGSRVQVLRGCPVDDCDPHGIERPERHLEVVR